jgi:acetylornithine deacetylase/succinyl-diaminopimelate desuccinylase-like protein
MLAPEEVLQLHQEIVSLPSLSGSEARLADWLEAWLRARGVAVERYGQSLLATCGSGPIVLLDTHLDTVPPAPAGRGSRSARRRRTDRVYGLGPTTPRPRWRR